MSNAPTFLILDGHNLAYRSFFAVRGLTAADGRPSNAVFGFIHALQALRDTHRPTHLAVVFDGGLPAERTALLPTYKAQRPPMPEDLRSQIEALPDFLSAARIPVFREPAQEADDVLATLALTAAREGAEVRIASNDKDLLQLVGERIRVAPPSSAAASEAWGPEQVRARTGVPPENIVEWLALTGDAADNIPGVPGVGPKTAAKLLEQFGGLDGLWRRIEEVSSPRLRAALLAERGTVERNLRLLRLRSDLPLSRTWRDCAIAAPDSAALRAFYERWNFRSLLRELDQPRLLL